MPATIALAPFRAIERTRGRRRLGLLVLYGLIAVVIWALLWRRSQLAGLPDVGALFDVAAFRVTRPRARCPQRIRPVSPGGPAVSGDEQSGG